MDKPKNILIVGAGFSGATIAHLLAKQNYNVSIIESRDHIGGNAYDYISENGIRIHKYGPHIFHTNNKKVVDFLSKFTDWIDYKHKVKAILDNGKYVTLPPNLETSEIVGKENVIDIFFRPYTKKMWGLEIEEISPTIVNRVPIREDMNEYYFPNDSFQKMPKNGYTELIKKMLDLKNINISLNTKFEKDYEKDYDHIFNSMPIDVYYDYKYGELPYRSIKFVNKSLPITKLLPSSVVNFTNKSEYTRVTEWKNFPNHGFNDSFTELTFEIPCDYKDNNFERYYPVQDVEGLNKNIFKKYSDIKNEKTTFIGRCGKYVYIDMDQAVSSAMSTAKRFLSRYE